VDWISGCALLIKRQVIDDVGVLDNCFFYYWEETDWCTRAREKGWLILHAPLAKIWHKGVQRDYRPSPNVTYYDTRNRFLFMAKHGAPLTAWSRVFWEASRTLVSWTIKPKFRDMHEHRNAMWQGIIDFIRGYCGIRTN